MRAALIPNTCLFLNDLSKNLEQLEVSGFSADRNHALDVNLSPIQREDFVRTPIQNECKLPARSKSPTSLHLINHDSQHCRLTERLFRAILITAQIVQILLHSYVSRAQLCLGAMDL